MPLTSGGKGKKEDRETATTGSDDKDGSKGEKKK